MIGKGKVKVGHCMMVVFEVSLLLHLRVRPADAYGSPLQQIVRVRLDRQSV